eukprot:CAMPEP_0197421572 /NCGR_PEP_ID=MMETSP1170-20131217/9299_1 /TAXON_ID=54406 /ORGANISM="Sarcinochrysis sp, Strain CCMP770" /LENGTH=105 /DNA_ID=CAMNT_0042948823 /DNA_START=18 /DNA_END=335 /DNA_ORIENTATION=+
MMREDTNDPAATQGLRFLRTMRLLVGLAILVVAAWYCPGPWAGTSDLIPVDGPWIYANDDRMSWHGRRPAWGMMEGEDWSADDARRDLPFQRLRGDPQALLRYDY